MVRTTSQTAAPRRDIAGRQEAVRRRLEAGRQAALRQLEASDSLVDVPRGPVESAEQVAGAFGTLPQVVRDAIDTTCVRNVVGDPPAEVLRGGCLACSDAYHPAEHLVTTPCPHSLHARCFIGWVRNNYQSTIDVCERWRLRCPHCHALLG